MPLPKETVLKSTASLARNNDWLFQQLQAPSKGPGALSEKLRAMISPEELPQVDTNPITGSVAGYHISQQGRYLTAGTITLKILESSDGEATTYFEKLKALNNPRSSSGELTGEGVLETEKEGEYSITMQSTSGKQVKKYTLKRAVVENVTPSNLSDSEEGEFVSMTVTIAYKDFVIRDAKNNVVS